METIGNYKYNTKDLIGHGAFAVVFKGCQLKDVKQLVAVKRITKKNFSRSQNVFNKEIKILREFSEDRHHHQNVVSLLDCVETSDYVFLVMEYCNGGDLADYLHVQGTLSEETIRLFIKQTANALKALHDKDIVHRDLKPQNILLCFPEHRPKNYSAIHPSKITLKIGDFGFARFLEDGVMAGTLCGSPMYMAPEVIMSKRYDGRADLWSVGTITYQCLTGQAPFVANTPRQLKQMYEDHANIQPNIPVNTSGDLRLMLQGLLKRNPQDRITFDKFFTHPFLNQKDKSLDQSSSSNPSTSPFSAINNLQQQQKSKQKSKQQQMFQKALDKLSSHAFKSFPNKDMRRSVSPTLEDFVVVDRCGGVLEGTSAPTLTHIGGFNRSPLISPSSSSSSLNISRFDKAYSTFPRQGDKGVGFLDSSSKMDDMTSTLTNPHSHTCPNMATVISSAVRDDEDEDGGADDDDDDSGDGDDRVDEDDYHDVNIPELKDFSPVPHFSDAMLMGEYAKGKRLSGDAGQIQEAWDFDKLDTFNNHTLSEDLLLDGKHNEIVSKLEYVSSLVECILTLVYLYEHPTPTTAHPPTPECNTTQPLLMQPSSGSSLLSSVYKPPPAPESLNKHSVITTAKDAAMATIHAGSQLTLLKPPSPSVYRRVFPPPPHRLELSIKQLLLYMKSLDYLLASLRMAAEEIKLKRLKATYNVKLCIKKLKVFFEVCLENSSILISKCLKKQKDDDSSYDTSNNVNNNNNNINNNKNNNSNNVNNNNINNKNSNNVNININNDNDSGNNDKDRGLEPVTLDNSNNNNINKSENTTTTHTNNIKNTTATTINNSNNSNINDDVNDRNSIREVVDDEGDRFYSLNYNRKSGKRNKDKSADNDNNDNDNDNECSNLDNNDVHIDSCNKEERIERVDKNDGYMSKTLLPSDVNYIALTTNSTANITKKLETNKTSNTIINSTTDTTDTTTTNTTPRQTKQNDNSSSSTAFETTSLVSDLSHLSNLRLPRLGAERLILKHALYCCQIATKEEIYGNSPNSVCFYHSALILLHSLVECCKHHEDETTLNKYKTLVEKRLSELGR